MRLKRITLSLGLVSFLLIMAVFLWPRSYDVAAIQERTGTQFWQLKTGSRIAYYTIPASGEIQNSPIIYLHGGPGGLIKDEAITALKPLTELGHTLYFYDQIGSGHSARLEDISEYSVQRHQADLHAIIDEIGAEKVILAAHSWGCLLAINFLQDYPERVESMILDGPGPILPIRHELAEQIPPDSLQLIPPEFSNRQAINKCYNWRARLILKYAHRFQSKLASDEEVDAFFTYLNQELSKATFCKGSEAESFPGGSGYYSHLMTIQSFDTVEDQRQLLRELELPVLILRGQCDNQAWGYTNEYLELFKNSRLEIINDAGHALLISQAEKYRQHARSFLLQNN
ncbi:alpha/beta fold hydrolase [Croceimicrobium hydrocarbonivorans]|uniref:Alpha/beta hydrolase n=1 Tax=Croceimicrobium hydrocarbonivorans TaxID=2761580 RepID=A0A7H0VAG4_9FLAO|nr:alpha/beta hydrolase [Croceimicrobium hydrocarbonivorans]QNR22712.1 alpha/beta hydrolase [Croceimicrobium hydrocarbonivorans]